MRQPPARLEFNPLHPLAEGLVAAWHPAHFPGSSILKDSAWGINGLIGAGTSGYPVSSDNPVMGVVRRYVATGNQYFGLASNPTLTTGDIDFTILAWVNRDDNTATRTVISKYDTVGNKEFSLEHTTARYRVVLSADGSATTVANGPIGVVGQWELIAFHHDSANNQVVFYQNGVASAPTAYATGLFSGTSLLKLAQGNGASWNGLIGPVYFYKRILSSTEHAMHYLDPHALFRPVGLRAGLPMAVKSPAVAGGSKYGLQTLVPGFGY